MRRFLVPLLLGLVVPASPAAAQDAEPVWFTVFADHVDISNQPAFEEKTRAFVRLFEDAGVEGVSWVTITGPDLGFAYSIPGKGPGDMDEMNESWGAAMQAIGEAGSRLMAESDALVESREMFFLLLRPDLSHNPETVGMSPDFPYRHYVQLQVHPAKAQAFEASATAWAEAYAKHGIERGFRVYQYMTGADLPKYLIVEHAKDEAEFHAAEAEIRAKLGADREALYARTVPTLKSVREMAGWVRPEFSYPSMSGKS
ncbi:MAG: hypothetical protein R6X22_13565 [Gemmatimonadota bacterium]